jgi:drug/metabolite transporter (DMT)-like permease
MLLSLIVLCRILSNPVSNVFQKLLTRRGADPLFIILLTHTLLSVICLPVVLVLAPHLSRTFWVNIAIVAVLTVAGNTLLVAAVKLSDLSVLGPVNAYKSIISLVPGMILLGEFPGRMGIAGMGLIVAGSYFIVDKNVAEPQRNVFVRFFTERGVQLRFAAMTVSAIEAVFLKKALLNSSATITFLLWAVLGCICAAIAVPLIGVKDIARQRQIVSADLPIAMLLAASTGAMQLCTIIVLAGFQVGYALALFQTSSLVSVFLGHHVFKEKNILERLGGSVVMVAGAVVIVAWASR